MHGQSRGASLCQNRGLTYHASISGSLLGLEEYSLSMATDGALLVGARKLDRDDTSAAGS